MCTRTSGLRTEHAKCWGLLWLSVTAGSSVASMNFSWEWDRPYLSFGGSWEGRRKHRGHMVVKQDGCEFCQQNSCAGSWQVLVSSVFQKRPAKQKYNHFTTGEPAFLWSAETEKTQWEAETRNLQKVVVRVGRIRHLRSQEIICFLVHSLVLFQTQV